ncbi:hypothetical protein [Pantoea sp. B65]|uniref:hypothetical protein n=1 Tax=Pantoea sp. B65 TaxID=2813359 RepID=UPI0039B3FE8E
MSTTFIEYSGLWLVIDILTAGVISSQLLSSKPVVIRWLADDFLWEDIVQLLYGLIFH